jgi:hypothetical protein
VVLLDRGGALGRDVLVDVAEGLEVDAGDLRERVDVPTTLARTPMMARFTRSLAPSTLPEGYQNAALTVAIPAPFRSCRLLGLLLALLIVPPTFVVSG